MKNIWVAAGDGDLERVKQLIEQNHISPNLPDENTYTPMHAAASYGHISVLEYLISQGGNVNVTDQDGDTPLYTVEDIDTARFLVQQGAIVVRQNNEGLSPIDHLTEDFPLVADYLRQPLGPSAPASSLIPVNSPSHFSQNLASEHLTSALMSSIDQIIQRAEQQGREPDEDELRQAVTRAVFDGVLTGFDMSTDNPDGRPPPDDPSPKRRRDNDN